MSAVDQWPALKVELRPLSRLKLDPANARRHPPQQIATLATLMLKHGVTRALLIDEADKVIAGEGRVLAADLNVQRGYDKFRQLPCAIATGWTEAQKRAYALADNQIALSSEWDEALLTEQLKGLMAVGEDLTGLSFSADDLKALNLTNDALSSRVNGATSFLDGINEPDPDAGLQAPDATGYVALSFTLLPAERSVIMRALKAEQAAGELKTIAAALLSICKRLNDATDRKP